MRLNRGLRVCHGGHKRLLIACQIRGSGRFNRIVKCFGHNKNILPQEDSTIIIHDMKTKRERLNSPFSGFARRRGLIVNEEVERREREGLVLKN